MRCLDTFHIATADKVRRYLDSIDPAKDLADLARQLELAHDAPQVLDATLQREPNQPYLWLLRALIHDRLGDSFTALQSWVQAGLKLPQTPEWAQLAALGWSNATAWEQTRLRFHGLKRELLRAAFDTIRAEQSANALIRIDRALAGYLGDAVVESPHPTQRAKVMYVPGLGTGGFLDAAQHPVAQALLAHAPVLQSEYQDVFREGVGVEPFLGDLSQRHPGAYIGGQGASPAWDAFFFYRHGKRYESNHQRCPKTSALLDAQDLCRIDAQAPEVCFSIMRPGTRIQPHHGVTNARVVVHIPLVVPPGCFLELTGVGRHHWREGVANVFDDTFEHAAENPTTSPRGILLLDAWHPGLRAHERHAFRALVEAISRIERPVLNPAT